MIKQLTLPRRKSTANIIRNRHVNNNKQSLPLELFDSFDSLFDSLELFDNFLISVEIDSSSCSSSILRGVILSQDLYLAGFNLIACNFAKFH